MPAQVCYIRQSGYADAPAYNFIFPVLEEIFGSVDYFEDETNLGIEFVSYDKILAANYKLIVVHQSEVIAKNLVEATRDSNLLFLPKYNAYRSLGFDFWACFKDKPNALVLSFSAALHSQLRFWGIRSVRFQYFPKVDAPGESNLKNQAKYLWAGTNVQSFEIVRTLIGSSGELNSFAHIAADSGTNLSLQYTETESQKKPVASTDTANLSDQRTLLNESTFYFVPVENEDADLSFLQAMGCGCCVVAPDTPLMNEYIDDGVNGILYDPNNPKEIDITNIASISRQAQNRVSQGYSTWDNDLNERLRYVLHSSLESDLTEEQEYTFWHWKNTVERALPVAPKSKLFLSTTTPSVTVAIVCRNSEGVIENTLLSVLHQTYSNFECVVVDGNSSDSTCEVIRRYLPHLSHFVSEADEGPFHAMSKAAGLGDGEYIIYINAGDSFYDSSSLEIAMQNVFGDSDRRYASPDFIIGNHVYRHASGESAYHRAVQFDQTWESLKSGNLLPHWWQGIPCHQATLTKRELVANEGYSRDFRIAADHEFMFRQRSLGKTFIHCNSTICAYVGGGLSSLEVNRCGIESWRIASAYADKEKIKQYFINVFGIESVYAVSVSDEKVVRDIRESGLFWEDWYKLNYLPIHLKNVDPIHHYLLEGQSLGAMPNPYFNPKYYYKQNPDVADAQIDAFVHYVSNGQFESRKTLDWTDEASPGAFLSKLLHSKEMSLAEIENVIATSDLDELLSCING